MKIRYANGLTILVAVALLLLIGLVLYVASDLVSNTVHDRFRSEERQLVTALARQTESRLTALASNVTSFSLQYDIKTTAVRDHDAGLALMRDEARRHPDAVRGIYRFDSDGVLRYGLDAVTEQVVEPDDVPLAVPAELVALTQDGDEVPLEVGLYRLPARTAPDALHAAAGAPHHALIAPVYTRLRRTEFVIFDLNLDGLFRQGLSVLDLGTDDQAWLLDAEQTVTSQARPSIELDILAGSPVQALLDAPGNGLQQREFKAHGEDHLATLATVAAVNSKFCVVVSRNTHEVAAGVQDDLQAIFLLAVGMVGLIATLSGLLLRRAFNANQRHQQEVQRRQSARTMLEMSRALNSSLDLESVLRSIMDQLLALVTYDSAAILLLDRSRLAVAAHRGVDVDDHYSIDDIDLNKANAAHTVIQTGRALLISDTRHDERWSAIMPNSEIRAWMGVPLRVREKTVGVLNINSHTPNRFSDEELALAEVFADQASVALQNARLHEFQVKQIEHELGIARDIQTSLLPAAAPASPHLQIDVFTQPAQQVSGDFYQYLHLPDGRLGVAVGDVSGKGIPAAMLMAVVMTALRDEVSRITSASDLLTALNRRLVERTQATHLNSALLVALFDPATRTLELANAGMVQPYLYDGETWRFVPVGGFPLGISPSARYTSKTVSLPPGGMLIFMSDGVVEAHNRAGELFGFERFEALINDLPRDTATQAVIERVRASVGEHLSGEAPQDDLTILAMRAVEVPVGGAPAGAAPAGAAPAPSSAAMPIAPAAQPVPDRPENSVIRNMTPGPKSAMIELQLPSILGYEKIARHAVEAFALQHEVSADRIEDLKTAVAEACMNAIEHGNHLEPGQMVMVRMAYTAAALEVTVADVGLRAMPSELPEPGTGDMRGWGLFLMTQLMDQVDMTRTADGGNQVRLSVHLAPEAAAAPPEDAVPETPALAPGD